MHGLPFLGHWKSHQAVEKIGAVVFGCGELTRFHVMRL